MKDERIYLVHMLETAQRVASRFANKSRESFNADDNLQLATVHLLQIIGEAARLVGESTRARLPAIQWKQITGMRHRLVHEYVNVNLNIVWDTATGQMDPLIEQLNIALHLLGDPRLELNPKETSPSTDLKGQQS